MTNQIRHESALQRAFEPHLVTDCESSNESEHHTMRGQNFTSSFTVEQNPAEVYDAINNVRGWWTGDIDGDSEALGDEFSYSYPGAHYSKQKITELVPGKKVVWHVVDSHLEAEDPSEWTGTEISFEIAPKEDGTEVSFTHLGLIPAFECYDACSSAWGFFVNGSLKHLITTGDGPTPPPWA